MSAYSMTQILETFAERIEAVSGGVPTVRMYQGRGPVELPFPYIGTHLKDVQRYSDHDAETFEQLEDDEDLTLTRQGPRRGCLLLSAYTDQQDLEHDPVELLERIVLGIQSLDATDAFDAVGVSYIGASTVKALPELHNGQWVKRAVVEVTFSFLASSTEQVSYIESVEGTINGTPFEVS